VAFTICGAYGMVMLVVGWIIDKVAAKQQAVRT
jgi:hypothetical protein